MAIGPVQLLVFGFEDPEFRGEISEVLQRLQDGGTVRVIDSLAVFKDAAGEIEVQHLSNGSGLAVEELGRLVGALIGLGVDGEEEFVRSTSSKRWTLKPIHSPRRRAGMSSRTSRTTQPPRWC